MGGRTRIALGVLASAVLAAGFWMSSRPGGSRPTQPLQAPREARPSESPEPTLAHPASSLSRHAGGCRIEGIVLAEGGAPAEGATVILDAGAVVTTSTDRGGSFAIDHLRQCTGTVRARKNAAVAPAVQVHLDTFQEPVILELRLGGVLRATVRGANDRRAVEGAMVTVKGAAEMSVRTDPEGKVEIAGLEPGGSDVEVVAAGYVRSVQHVSIPANSHVVTIRLLLQKGEAVHGSVVDQTGHPVADVNVSVLPAALVLNNQSVLLRARTGTDGVWRIAAAPAGLFRVACDHPRFLPSSSGSFVVDGTAATAAPTVVLRVGRAAAGRVRTVQALPARRVAVTGWQVRGGTTAVMRGVVADDDGRFELTGLPAGPIKIAARGDAASSRPLEIDLTNADARDVDLVLDLDERLEGTVVDHEGLPVAGAQVATISEDRALQPGIAETSGGHYASDLTDGRGRFRLIGLEAGDYRVRASRQIGPSSPEFWLGRGVLAHTGDVYVRIVLDEDGVIKGRVRAKPDGGPIPFTVAMAGSPPLTYGPGDEFRVTNVPTGRHALRFTANGYAPKLVDGIDVQSREAVDLGTVEMDTGRIVRGRVQRGDGTPVSGAVVVAGAQVIGAGSESAGDAQALSDDAGDFVLAGLGQGTVSVFASHSTEGRSLPVQLSPDAASRVTLILAPVVGIEGIVTNGPAPLEGAPVVAFKKNAGNARLVAITGPDGHYQFDQLSAGEWLLQASVQASPTALILQVVAAVLEGGSNNRADIDISRGDYSIAAKVLEPDGSPLANGQVYLATGAITAATGGELDRTLAERGPGQTRMELLMQGRAVRFSQLTAGSWSLCVIAVRGDLTDPAVVQRIRDNPDSLPVQCERVEIPASGDTVVLHWRKN